MTGWNSQHRDQVPFCVVGQKVELRRWPGVGPFLADCTELIPWGGQLQLCVLQGLCGPQIWKPAALILQQCPTGHKNVVGQRMQISKDGPEGSILANYTELNQQRKQCQPCVLQCLCGPWIWWLTAPDLCWCPSRCHLAQRGKRPEIGKSSGKLHMH